MTVSELQGWFEDNVNMSGGFKGTDIIHIDSKRHIVIFRDQKLIATIDPAKNTLKAE